MRPSIRVLPVAALVAAWMGSMGSMAIGQTPPSDAPPQPPTPSASGAPAATPTPPVSVEAPAAPAAAAPAAPVPTPVTAMRITDPPLVSIARLPAENPFGTTAQVPAALPAKLPFADGTVSARPP